MISGKKTSYYCVVLNHMEQVQAGREWEIKYWVTQNRMNSIYEGKINQQSYCADLYLDKIQLEIEKVNLFYSFLLLSL